MKPLVFLRIVGLSACAAVAPLLLPSPGHARVHVSVGIGLPIPVLVAPAPVVVYPAPVVYAAPPVVVGPSYYGYEGPRRGHCAIITAIITAITARHDRGGGVVVATRWTAAHAALRRAAALRQQAIISLSPWEPTGTRGYTFLESVALN